MSHLHERKEKICLNCKADLIDRYCHHCGQENLEPKETVWHLVQHFFNDVTHFDGKFFSSVKYLMRRPGFLSKEYMNGRRASYLNPIRMYVFSSAIFFLLFFSLKKPEELINTTKEDRHTETHPEKGKTYADLVKERDELEGKIAKADSNDVDRDDLEARKVRVGLEMEGIKKQYGDTSSRVFSRRELKTILAKATVDTVFASIKDKKDTAHAVPAYKYHGDTGKISEYVPAKSGHKKGRDTLDLDQKIASKVADKIEKEKAKKPADDDDDDGFNFFGISAGQYKTVAQYDSAQVKLPANERDGWVTRQATKKMIVAQAEFHENPEGYIQHFAEHLLHSIPKILFISLPFFALILNILYFRQKKTFYYVSHGIFTIHLYCATFILSMAILLLNKLYNVTSWQWLHVIIGLVIFVIVLYMLIYLYKAMRGFYGQGRFKTFIKYFLTCWIAFFINTILFVLFVLISAISI